MLTRRDLIKMGLLGSSGFVLIPPGGGLARVSRYFDDNAASPPLTPFVDALPTVAPPLTQVAPFSDVTPYAIPHTGPRTRYFEIAAVEANVKIHRDLPPASMWTYVDRNAPPASNRLFTFQFPTTELGEPDGDGLLIRVHNQLPTAPRDFGFPNMTVHFHGGHQPSAADGFPHDLADRTGFADLFPAHVTIPVGGFYDYAYPFRDCGFLDGPITTDERPSTYWFHDHFLDFTGANVYRGLAGIAPVFDEVDENEEEPDGDVESLRLPSGPHDIPLVLLDKTFDISGGLVFDPFDQDGAIGDTITVNGVAWPYFNVRRRKYRFRFLDGSNARIFQVFLTNDLGHTFPMTQIATEAGLLAHPIRNLASVLLYMSERVEIVIDFADPVFDGQRIVYFENRMAQTNGRKPDGLTRTGTKFLKFIIDPAPVDDPSQLPDTLRPFATVPASEIAAAEHRAFEFNRSHGVFTINGEPVNLEKPLVSVRRNTPQIWTFRNSSGGWWHPIHVHSEYMRVLRRNGAAPPADERDGNARKDAILLRDNETVSVFVKFRDYSGPFVFHCHNLEHEDMAMMARFDVLEP